MARLIVGRGFLGGRPGSWFGMAKEEQLKKGDDVSWQSHGQTVHGTVQGRITERTKAAGRTVEASPDDPQYKVTSDKTGKEAVHKPGALERD